MFNFIVCRLSVCLVCEDRLSYYHLGRILLGNYATMVILLDLGILGQAMSGWLGGIHPGGHHSTFFHSKCRAHWRCRRGCEFGGIVGIG